MSVNLAGLFQATKMFTSSKKAKQSTSGLKINLVSELLVVCPDYGLDELPNEPRHDAIVQGSIELTLHKDTRIKAVLVELIGKQDVLIRGVWHSYTTLKEKLDLDIGKDMLSAGTHHFAFEIVVPADTAPYESCEHGKTIHTIHATACPCGVFEGDIVADPRRVTIHTNHTLHNRDGIATFSATAKSENPDLGFVGLTLGARYLVLVGYLDLDLNISRLRYSSRIVNVELRLIQTWSVSSLEEASHIEKHSPSVFKLWSSRDAEDGSKEAARLLPAGDDFHLQKRVLLPDDPKIRSSTAKRSKTGLRASHELEVCMTYFSLKDTEPKGHTGQIRMKVSALIHACDCVLEARQLPLYEEHAHMDAARLPFEACDQRARCRQCACSLDRTDIY